MIVLVVLFFGLALNAADVVTRPFVGVTHTHRAALGLHVVSVDLRARGIRVTLSGPGGTRETIRRTTPDFMESVGAQVAINAHFFLPYPSEEADADVIGLAASEGVVYSWFERPTQAYALVAAAPAIHIDRFNRASVIDDAWPGVLWTAVAGSAQIVTGGRVTIPAYAPLGALTPGEYTNTRSWYAVRTARTVIGLSRDRRRLVLVTAEKMDLPALAAVLVRDFGVYEALNLDGGGSTTLAMENGRTGVGEVLNSPTGGRPRRVASSLAVFAARRR
ncbi:MAG: phosphodiester glycosidase family protein [Bryobacterales bacterium]|nr:phosphodiester glycosidase family protein [Bryobacterales bacterium]